VTVKRSPLSALRRLAERTVTVADLASAEIWQVPGEISAAEAVAELDARDFDVAAVAESPISRFVHRQHLREHLGNVTDASLHIDAGEIVGRALPVADLVSRLGACERVFVMDEEIEPNPDFGMIRPDRGPDDQMGSFRLDDGGRDLSLMKVEPLPPLHAPRVAERLPDDPWRWRLTLPPMYEVHERLHGEIVGTAATNDTCFPSEMCRHRVGSGRCRT